MMGPGSWHRYGVDMAGRVFMRGLHWLPEDEGDVLYRAAEAAVEAEPDLLTLPFPKMCLLVSDEIAYLLESPDEGGINFTRVIELAHDGRSMFLQVDGPSWVKGWDAPGYELFTGEPEILPCFDPAGEWRGGYGSGWDGMRNWAKRHPWVSPPHEMDLWIAIAPIILANVKNVEIVDEPMTRGERRTRKRRGGVVYKVLNITIPTRRGLSEGSGGERLTRRHLVRGHFKTYTAENPLFGQHVGTYWFPAHARGEVDEGVVEKSYAVSA